MAELTDDPGKWTRRERLIDWLTLIFVVVVSAWLFSAALRHRPTVMRYLEDDFFYYAKVATNIVAGRGSTFDGTTPTNGYHPLYLLVLLPAAWVKSGLTSFLVELWLLAVAAATITFAFARRIFRAVRCEPLLANGLGLLALWLPVRMFFQCMEVTLTIPLAMALLWLFVAMLSEEKVSTSRAGWAGLVAVLMVLSRLDSALLVLLLLIAVLAEPGLRAKLTGRAVTAFAIAAGVPLLSYLASNHVWFGTWMPVSGMAKQLRFSHMPSRIALHSAWFGKGKLLLAMAVVALAGWFLLWRRLRPEWRAVLLAAILLPLVQIGVFCILSDWQMWGWYHYAFTPALLALFVLLAFWWNHSESYPRWSQMAGVGALLLGGALTATNHWKTDPEMAQIGDAAEQLREFATTHPGTYAMGDRSGMVAWSSSQPLFQTEGLVEDRAWVETIRSQQDLASALRGRGVRYYVTTEWEGAAPGFVPAIFVPAGCTVAVEPMQAGPTAPHLQSVFCSAPVAAIKIPAEQGFPAKRVLVFDLKSN